jgi:hypothetical protein
MFPVRRHPLLGLVAAAICGCGGQESIGAAEGVLSAVPGDAQLVRATRSVEDLVELTNGPYPTPSDPTLCFSPSAARAAAAVHGDDALGPHGVAHIRVFASPEAAQKLRDDRDDLPVGAVLIKEKLDGPGLPTGLWTGMVKREPDYHPACGDWEFFIVERGELTARGRMKRCTECHRGFSDRGYLSLDYLNLNPSES